MTWKNTAERYGRLSIGLHWLMALLLLAVYCTMEFRGIFPKGSDWRTIFKQTHFMLGASIFFLVWARLLVRLIAPTPQISPAPHDLQNKVAKLMYLALYLLMICTPLLGWLLLNAEGKLVPFFGLELPALVDKDRALAKQLEYWHVLVAQSGYWLIAIHTGAALFHRLVLKDNALAIILPRRS